MRKDDKGIIEIYPPSISAARCDCIGLSLGYIAGTAHRREKANGACKVCDLCLRSFGEYDTCVSRSVPIREHFLETETK